jgi:hypothetical protein
MADWATLLEAIAALASALLWPAVAALALILFRAEIRDLLSRIRRGVIMGQQIELDKLDRSALAAESEVAALPRSEEPNKQGSRDTDTEDVERQVLNEAARSPKAALLLLASEVEREVRELLATFGRLGDKPYPPFREAIRMLQQNGTLPEHVLSSVELFWEVRNRLVHGRDASDDAVLRAIDSGITILRALRAIPREVHTVLHPGVDVYADPEGQRILDGVRGVILESRGPDATAMLSRRMFATTKTHFQKGKRVAWEWEVDRAFGAAWYRDPDTQEIKQAWSGSLNLVGRHLEDL